MAPAGLLLTPGASASRDHPTLLALEAAVGHALPQIAVERCDLPRTAAKAVLAVCEQIEGFARRLGVGTDRIVAGGRSFGGRMTSMAAAEGLALRGLALLSYPLHPPGKPERLRIEHLPRIAAPTLAISGDRDPFGTPAHLREHLGAVPRMRLELVPGTHSPPVAAVADILVAWLRELSEDDQEEAGS